MAMVNDWCGNSITRQPTFIDYRSGVSCIRRLSAQPEGRSVAVETMQSWFGLKEGHNDFSIETETDAALFFARHELDEQLNALLRRSFRTGNPPKMVLYGDWGVGKTHTMRHMQYVIEHNDDFQATVIFVE